MSQTLIIPDVHLRWRLAEALIEEVGPDKVVFLGDFFDQFGDNPDQAGAQAVWLRRFLHTERCTFLWGNHDLAYAYPGLFTQCSGYRDDKAAVIRSVLTAADWQKFKWFHWELSLFGDWLLSHAGLHPRFMPRADRELFRKSGPGSPFDLWLKAECRAADRALAAGESHWAFRAGRSRVVTPTRHTQAVGGLTWLDFNLEFNGIRGINQLVGHTPQAGGLPQDLNLKGRENWCIDTHGAHYATLTDGRLSVCQIPERLQRLRLRLD